MDRRELRVLFGLLFRNADGSAFRPYEYQLDLALPIVSGLSKRIITTMPTRAGKSHILALTTLLLTLERPGQAWNLIAPRQSQARILMNYVIQHLADSKPLRDNLPAPLQGVREVGRLQREVSKERITFQNGSEIRILSAQGSADRLLGFGGNVILDESPLIPDSVYESMILRMLGDSPDSVLVQIGNPVSLNHFYEDWHDPRFLKVRVTWRECVSEGRFSREFVDEQRGALSESYFRVMYEAEFVPDATDALIPFDSISNSVEAELESDDKADSWYELGVDVARGGRDQTVITVARHDEDSNTWVERVVELREKDLMNIVGRVKQLASEYEAQSVKVDDVGLGGGVTDRLRELGVPVVAFNAARRPASPRLYANKKTEEAWRLRQSFVEGRISIPRDHRLVSELRKWTLKIDSSERQKLVDPEDKSPDYADSLLLACVRSGFKVGGARVF